MISKELLDRINELARKSKAEGLSECECAEQTALRKEYLAAFRCRMRDVLDNTYIQEPDGTKHKLGQKEE